jgi:hypothetical protein
VADEIRLTPKRRAMKVEGMPFEDRFGQLIAGSPSFGYRSSLAFVRWPIVHQVLPALSLDRIIRMLASLLLAGGLLTSHLAAGADVLALLIVQPSHGETIHDNIGEVTVKVALQGADMSAGKYLRVLLDGKSYREKLHTLSFAIEHVDRGEHTLQVALLDANNAIVVESPTITFYLWQASRQFPPPKM